MTVATFESHATDTNSPFLTLGEVLRYLRVNDRTVYRLIRSRELPATRIGRQWRIHRSDLERFIEAQRVGLPNIVTVENSDKTELWVENEQIQEVTGISR